MHVTNGEQNFTDVKHTDVVAEPPVFSQTIEEFPSCAILKNHVNENFILEGGFEGVDEGMVEFRKYFFL